jgi:predicted ATPase
MVASSVPLPAVPLLGRGADLSSLKAQLIPGGARLVDLVGPPGVGKTLLSAHLAWELEHTYRDGAVLVSLDSIRESNLVPSVLMRSLGLREQVGHSLTETLQEHLRDAQMLLVVDNFEHVLEAASVVHDILAACPEVTIPECSGRP